MESITLMEFTMRQVEDLFNQLENLSPGVKELDRKKIMRALASIFNTRVKYRGKKREYVVYNTLFNVSPYNPHPGNIFGDLPDLV